MELASTLSKNTTTDYKEGEQLEDRRNVGGSSCNSGDGTDQRVQSLMFMMMMIICDCGGGLFLAFIVRCISRIKC
jgi:hypothetical protein